MNTVLSKCLIALYELWIHLVHVYGLEEAEFLSYISNEEIFQFRRNCDFFCLTLLDCNVECCILAQPLSNLYLAAFN